MRKKTTIYIEDAVLRAAKIQAVREGKRDYEIVEEALRQYLGLDLVERIWDRARKEGLRDNQALRIAYEELHQARKDRAKRR